MLAQTSDFGGVVFLPVLLLVPVLLGLVPAKVASSKGRSFALWWLYGALLFLPALIHSLLIQPELEAEHAMSRKRGMMRCPFCAEYIQPDAIVCRYCGRSLAVLSDVPSMPAEESHSEMLENDLIFTHAGNRYLLGFGWDYWAIWKKDSDGPPAKSFEYSQEGWAAAWLLMNEMDTNVRALSPEEAADLSGYEDPDDEDRLVVLNESGDEIGQGRVIGRSPLLVEIDPEILSEAEAVEDSVGRVLDAKFRPAPE